MKLLMRRLLSIAASSSALVFMGLASLPHDASAEATFKLSLAGPAIRPCSTPCQSEEFEWRGIVTLVTSSGADGTYEGPRSLFLSVDSNLFSQTSNGVIYVNGDPYPDIFASATILNGQVTSFDFYFNDGADLVFEEVIFGGLEATYELTGLHQGGDTFASAILVNIPEPEIVSLMLAGLLLTGLVRRSRKSAHASRGARDSAMPAPVTP